MRMGLCANTRSSSKGRTGKNPALGTIETGPFYGVELLPSIGNSAGLLANSAGQVLHQRHHPIAGLYASGVVAVRDEGGAGYQAGLTLAAAMTFSYLAVQHMVSEATRISRATTDVGASSNWQPRTSVR